MIGIRAGVDFRQFGLATNFRDGRYGDTGRSAGSIAISPSGAGLELVFDGVGGGGGSDEEAPAKKPPAKAKKPPREAEPERVREAREVRRPTNSRRYNVAPPGRCHGT